MRDRYDLFGSLPDTIETSGSTTSNTWTRNWSVSSGRRANAFDLRYGSTVDPEGPGWELCERVLARRDVVERMSEGW